MSKTRGAEKPDIYKWKKTDLVIPEPNFVVKNGKGKNMVDKRLCSACLWWDTKYLV
jgi:hypothetical protein